MLCISCFCSIFRQSSRFGTFCSSPKQCKHVLDFPWNPSWNLLEICSVKFVDTLLLKNFHVTFSCSDTMPDGDRRTDRHWKGSYSCFHEHPTSELQDITCCIDSHRVTCDLTQVNVPRLNSSQTSWYSICLPWSDGRLYNKMAYLYVDTNWPSTSQY